MSDTTSTLGIAMAISATYSPAAKGVLGKRKRATLGPGFTGRSRFSSGWVEQRLITVPVADEILTTIEVGGDSPMELNAAFNNQVTPRRDKRHWLQLLV